VNRRAFFQRTVGAVVAATFAPRVVEHVQNAGQFHGLQSLLARTPTTGVCGAINKATFSFWRNQRQGAPVLGGRTHLAYDSAFSRAFKECR
jgi:hypothetical protein